METRTEEQNGHTIRYRKLRPDEYVIAGDRYTLIDGSGALHWAISSAGKERKKCSNRLVFWRHDGVVASTRMKVYPEEIPSSEDWKNFPFTKFKVIAASEEDKRELMEAFRHIHDSHIDTGFVTVNQLAHLYQDNEANPNRIVVDPSQFND